MQCMAFNNTNADILVAGAFAAFTVDLLVYPLDTIKTRLQSPDYKRLFTHASTNSVNRSLFRGLYQGIGSVVIATVPSCTIDIAISQSTAISIRCQQSLYSPSGMAADAFQQERSSPPTRQQKRFSTLLILLFLLVSHFFPHP